MSQNSGNQSANNFSLVPVENNEANGNSPGNSENQSSSSNRDANATPNLPEQNFRQPQTLQELMKISTRLQGSSDEATPREFTDDRSEFLKKALNAIAVDLVPQMQARLDILKEIENRPENFVDTNLNKYEDALEQLIEFLYEIDLAKIFYQIDGLNVIAPLLRSKHASLRTATAAIILECCKNNPFCQELTVADEVFGPLMEIATSDPNRNAMFKAIAAVSAIIRSNPVGINQFNRYNGIQMLEKALNSGCEKIVNKAIFLIIALCDTDETLKNNLTESGTIVTLITLLQLSDFIVKEYILRALLSITADNPVAREICLQHDLKTYLSGLCQTHTEPECQDMVECAKTLQTQL